MGARSGLRATRQGTHETLNPPVLYGVPDIAKGSALGRDPDHGTAESAFTRLEVASKRRNPYWIALSM